jgi:hypothetical protein
VTGGDDAGDKVELAALVVGQDGGGAVVVKAIGKHKGHVIGHAGQRHALVVFGDIDQPFDPVAQEGVDQGGGLLGVAAGVGDHQGHAGPGQRLLNALNDEEFGQAGGLHGFG